MFKIHNLRSHFSLSCPNKSSRAFSSPQTCMDRLNHRSSGRRFFFLIQELALLAIFLIERERLREELNDC